MLPLLAISMWNHGLAPGRSAIFRKGEIDVVDLRILAATRHQPMGCESSIRHYGKGREIGRIGEPIRSTRNRLRSRPPLRTTSGETQYMPFR